MHNHISPSSLARRSTARGGSCGSAIVMTIIIVIIVMLFGHY